MRKIGKLTKKIARIQFLYIILFSMNYTLSQTGMPYYTNKSCISNIKHVSRITSRHSGKILEMYSGGKTVHSLSE
jgi:hypothetical protein